MGRTMVHTLIQFSLISYSLRSKCTRTNEGACFRVLASRKLEWQRKKKKSMNWGASPQTRSNFFALAPIFWRPDFFRSPCPTKRLLGRLCFFMFCQYYWYCIMTDHQDKEAEKKERQSTPHLWNLNPDPQLTGMIIQIIKPGQFRCSVCIFTAPLNSDFHY